MVRGAAQGRIQAEAAARAVEAGRGSVGACAARNDPTRDCRGTGDQPGHGLPARGSDLSEEGDQGRVEGAAEDGWEWGVGCGEWGVGSGDKQIKLLTE